MVMVDDESSGPMQEPISILFDSAKACEKVDLPLMRVVVKFWGAPLTAVATL